ncbi:hypothetical protein O1611_g1751 [Lasiodiplodia mahajangana]|uniref:Uncharacterized protein n=1 Tax=Lasiodiplodia mahajangana TaxID=1108764 RepID=A0ACC2JWG9_9PEZI|nr:hypothetical protein O1611_g1751 [Lasiodiplodia mahajangana]
MDIDVYNAPININDESLRQLDTKQEIVDSDLPVEENTEDVEKRESDKEEDNLNPLVDPELNRLVTEWRISKTRESYKPYSEEELRRFGTLWKVGEPPQEREHMSTADEIHGCIKSVETLHEALSGVADKFYELAWTRRYSPDYWNHLWLTFHLAGATVEGVWEITRNKWPKLVKERRPFNPNEIEKLRKFVRTSDIILRECDIILNDFDFKREEACLIKLYNVLRTFPIAPRWKRSTSWGAQDKVVRRRGFGIMSWFGNWF